ncbi:hypothetical protein IMG5_113010, partial [Ichthyophthirius multifiliis]
FVNLRLFIKMIIFIIQLFEYLILTLIFTFNFLYLHFLPQSCLLRVLFKISLFQIYILLLLNFLIFYFQYRICNLNNGKLYTLQIYIQQQQYILQTSTYQQQHVFQLLYSHIYHLYSKQVRFHTPSIQYCLFPCIFCMRNGNDRMYQSLDFQIYFKDIQFCTHFRLSKYSISNKFHYYKIHQINRVPKSILYINQIVYNLNNQNHMVNNFLKNREKKINHILVYIINFKLKNNSIYKIHICPFLYMPYNLSHIIRIFMYFFSNMILLHKYHMYQNSSNQDTQDHITNTFYFNPQIIYCRNYRHIFQFIKELNYYYRQYINYLLFHFHMFDNYHHIFHINYSLCLYNTPHYMYYTKQHFNMQDKMHYIISIFLVHLHINFINKKQRIFCLK